MKGVVALALALLLAGCLGSNTKPAGPQGDDDGPNAATAALPMPIWALRDHWTYTAGEDPSTYVVTGETASDWIVGTDNEERAFHDARNDVSRLGPQRKSDLAGSQGADRIEFFRWPLTSGLNWTTRWDGQLVTIRAHVQDGLAHMEAVDANGSLAYRYTYDAKVRWLSELRHFAPDGTERVALKLTASGRNYTGDVVSWELDPIIRASGDISFGARYSGDFQVPLTATDVWARVVFACTSGSILLGVAPFPVLTTMVGLEPRGAGGGATPCPGSLDFGGTAGPPKPPPQGGASEVWGWSISAPPGGVGTYEFEVIVRTLQTTAVPESS